MEKSSLAGWPLKKIKFYYRRRSANYVHRRCVRWPAERATVSFTFDDFPKSAYRVGGTILRRYGVQGTFYASFGLTNLQTPVGEIFSIEDIRQLVKDGHELGCHTYYHLDAYETDPAAFNNAIVLNRAFLAKHFPQVIMETFSYPISQPSPSSKGIAAGYYGGCRGGGQKSNGSVVDLNLIKSCFIDYKNNADIGPLLDLLDRNSTNRGWLVFSTHDVGVDISKFGCPTDMLQELVARALEKGSKVLAVRDVCSLF